MGAAGTSQAGSSSWSSFLQAHCPSFRLLHCLSSPPPPPPPPPARRCGGRYGGGRSEGGGGSGDVSEAVGGGWRRCGGRYTAGRAATGAVSPAGAGSSVGAALEELAAALEVAVEAAEAVGRTGLRTRACARRANADRPEPAPPSMSCTGRPLPLLVPEPGVGRAGDC